MVRNRLVRTQKFKQVAKDRSEKHSKTEQDEKAKSFSKTESSFHCQLLQYLDKNTAEKSQKYYQALYPLHIFLYIKPYILMKKITH